MKTWTQAYLAFSFLFLLNSCANKDFVAKTLKENPEILADAIKQNPKQIFDALQSAQRELASVRQKEMDKPKFPKLTDAQVFDGPKDAKVTIVEYTDFQCPYCQKGSAVLDEVKKQYSKDVRVTLKHYPLNFHKQAMISAQYYEAIRLQNPEKALKFKKEVFSNQAKLNEGEAFLKKTAQKLGMNMAKLAKDLESETVKQKIAADVAEAQSFGINGTPAFFVNGQPVRGLVPKEHFGNLIKTALQKG